MSYNAAFVFIVESPSASDLLDGRTEGKALSEALNLCGISGWYCLATSKNIFLRALETKLSEALTQFPKMAPILHFSMHGNSEGISFTNDDFISWRELWELLSPLNDALQGGLLICMSSCFGAAGCRMAMSEEIEKPFWALIGHSGETEWGDAAVAYITFYHQIFKGSPLDSALRTMQVASGDPNFLVFSGDDSKNAWTSLLHQKNLNDDNNPL